MKFQKKKGYSDLQKKFKAHNSCVMRCKLGDGRVSQEMYMTTQIAPTLGQEYDWRGTVVSLLSLVHGD